MESAKLFMALFGLLMLFFAINAMGQDRTDNEVFSYSLEHAMEEFDRQRFRNIECDYHGVPRGIKCEIFFRNIIEPNLYHY